MTSIDYKTAILCGISLILTYILSSYSLASSRINFYNDSIYIILVGDFSSLSPKLLTSLSIF